MRLYLLAAVAVCVAGCSSSDDAVRDFSARDVTLPDGTTIKVEVMTNPVDMSRGMMFRDSLAPDRGMLFIHGSPGKYPYWMFQVKIPLDIIWMDQNRRVVEISADTPACASKSAKDCPNYGGHEGAMYVLEIGAGQGARHGVQIGSVINF